MNLELDAKGDSWLYLAMENGKAKVSLLWRRGTPVEEREWRYQFRRFYLHYQSYPAFYLGPQSRFSNSERYPAFGFFTELPAWIPAPFFAAYPLVVFLRGPLRRRRRRARGECPRCGYDLTGNVSGVCPECGTNLKNAETQKS